MCPLELSNESTVYAYVEVHNPNNRPALVEIEHKVGDNSNHQTDSVMAAYAAIPDTAAARTACVGQFNYSCETLNGPACLRGASAVEIPAQSSRFIYIGERTSGRTWNETSWIEATIVNWAGEPAPGAIPRLQLPATLNQSASVAVPESRGKIAKPIGNSGTRGCPLTLDDKLTEHAYVEVHNPNNRAAKVELLHTIRTGTATDNDAFMAAYSAMPTNDAARTACIGAYNQACTGRFGPGCMIDDNAVTIPAQSSRFIYLGMWNPDHGWNSTSQLEASIVGWQ